LAQEFRREVSGSIPDEGSGEKMAKGQRELLALVCPICKNQNYITEKNKTNTTNKLVLKKYCKKCKKRTEHKEGSKLK